MESAFKRVRIRRRSLLYLGEKTGKFLPAPLIESIPGGWNG